MSNERTSVQRVKTVVGVSIYILVALAVGSQGALQALSDYHAESAVKSGSVREAQLASFWRPGNPDAYSSRAELAARNEDLKKAESSLLSAISLRENDVALWLELGGVRERAGDTDGAIAAFETARRLAPFHSRPVRRLGLLHLRNSEKQKAFELLNLAANREPVFYPEVLELARTASEGDAGKLDEFIQPESSETRMRAALYLIDNGLMTRSIKAFILSDELATGRKNDLVRILRENRNYELAREVWLSTRDTRTNASEGLVFDGGFEQTSSSDESGFGWRFDLNQSDVTITLDREIVHSGSRSLKMRFSGSPEPGRRLLLQFVNVRGETEYVVSVFVRSPEMISAGPPQMVARDPDSGKVLGMSDPLLATEGNWKEVRFKFKSGSTPIVEISLSRARCPENPCPIFGDLNLDDISVSEIDTASKE